MNKRRFSLTVLGAAALLVLLALAGSFTLIPKVFSSPLSADEGAVQQQVGADDEVVLSYSAKFVCTATQPPGVPFYGAVAPVVQQTTEILVHNPNDYPVEISKVANLSPVEPPDAEIPTPLPWIPYGPIPAGGSFSIDCNDISTHLLVQPFQIGVTYEGIVTIAIGPHQMFDELLYPQLDVIAEYTRGSEVLKKDIHYQPWWTYWPWDFAYGDFPWRLGYPYQRIIRLSEPTDEYYDCRDILIQHLFFVDVVNFVTDPVAQHELQDALRRGMDDYFLSDYPGDDPFGLAPENPEPALIPIIGRCEASIDSGNAYLEVSYVMVSNLAPLGSPIYPWIPGRWHDMPVVIPQNTTIDFDYLFQYWHAYLWSDHIDYSYSPEELWPYMDYFFPYWSGWTGWWWNYNGTDSIDIGVGEGESIDIEQIMPLRVIRPWQVVDITPSE